MRNVDWSPRDPRDFVEDKLTVTITLMEYRELVSKAALYDVMYASEQGEEASPLPNEVGEADDAQEPLRRP